MARVLLLPSAKVVQLRAIIIMKYTILIWWVAAATASGQVQYAFTNWAGSPGVVGTTDGTGNGASFNQPFNLARNNNDEFYISDSFNHTIRKLTSGRVVTTFTGTGLAAGTNDATGSAARFNRPDGVAVDSQGNVYVADSYNYTIRKITPAGAVSTFAGSPGQIGTVDAQGTAARFYLLAGLAVDKADNVYVADRYNHTIRRITPGGAVATIGGLGGTSGTNDGAGNLARFNFPTSMAVDQQTNIFVADTGNHTIRKMVGAGTNWVVTTIAGFPAASGTNDGAGLSARFNVPRGVAFDSAGNLYVADSNNHTIRIVTFNGTDWIVATLAGNPGVNGSAPGTNNVAKFYGPRDVAFDSLGNLFVTDASNYRISKGVTLAPPVILPSWITTSISGGLFELQVPNAAGSTETVLEVSSNLFQWQPILTNSGGPINYSEPLTSHFVRYFRAYSR